MYVIYIYICIHTWGILCTYVCMYVSMYVYVWVYVSVYASGCIYVWMYVFLYVCVYIRADLPTRYSLSRWTDIIDTRHLSFSPQLLGTQWNRTLEILLTSWYLRHPLDRRLDGPQSSSEHCAQRERERNLKQAPTFRSPKPEEQTLQWLSYPGSKQKRNLINPRDSSPTSQLRPCSEVLNHRASQYSQGT
jgi:hypothetical protein